MRDLGLEEEYDIRRDIIVKSQPDELLREERRLIIGIGKFTIRTDCLTHTKPTLGSEFRAHAHVAGNCEVL